MDVQKIRLQLYRIPVRMTVASKFRDLKDWEDEEIEETKHLMAESYDEHAGTLILSERRHNSGNVSCDR